MSRLFARNMLLLILLVLAGGCAPTQKPLRILWPIPPDQPKIEFVGIFASEQDFVKTSSEALTAQILGTQPQYVFKSPVGIVSNGNGLVFVSDLHDRNVRVYDFNRKTVEFLSKDPIFKSPFGLALDPEGNLYVADIGAAKVLVFSPERRLIRVIGGPDLLETPGYLVINPGLGRLYVSDSKKCEIFVFNLNGELLFRFGKKGGGDGEFAAPQGLAFSPEGELFVADRLNARIEVFDADGRFVRKFGERGDRFYQFEAPKDLAFDSEGNLWVVDQRRSAIYTYTPEGRILLVTGSSAATDNPLGFATPMSICIDVNDRIYVADMLNRRFAVWQYLNPTYLKQHPVTPEDLQRIEEERDRSAAAAKAKKP